jgi:hypothetical protein
MKTYTGSGADATFDELALYDFGGAGPGGIPAATSDTLESPEKLAANRFREGRYYRESAYPDTGGLVQPPGPARKAGEYFSPLIRIGACRIRAIAWTQVVSRGLRAPLPPSGQPGIDGDLGPDGTILMELTDGSGGNYLEDASGRRITQTFDRPASSLVERTVNAPFRLHAVFKPNLNVPPGGSLDNTPILDPLTLDDITVVHEPLGGRRLLAWEQGE